MKSVLIVEKGKVEFGETSKPVCQPHHVLIKVDCAVINPSDRLFMQGKFFAEAIGKYPIAPGWEGAGTIVEVGSDHAEKGLVGMRVGFLRCKESG